jgi:hypothetical protein
MSFVIVRNNTRARFSENQIYLNYITSLEPKKITDPIPLELKIMKGLFQVHLYASLEKTLNELIENTLAHIGSNGIKNIHYSIPFNTISLVDRLKSFKNCAYGNFFNKSIEIFAEMTSSNVLTINETAFANNLQNVWTKTIEEIIKAFGIKGFIIPQNVKTTIDELVDKRNAVAHGRESASQIGERFRADVLRLKMETIAVFSNDLIDLFENYYSNKEFLKGSAKRHYTAATT